MEKALEQRQGFQSGTAAGGENVSTVERCASLAGGWLFLKRFFKHPSLLSAAISGTMFYRGATGHCPIYERLGIDTARDGYRRQTRQQRAFKSIHINRSPEELFKFWRNLENLPQVMSHLESVTNLDDGRSRWRARAPFGKTVEWTAEVTSEKPNERISWSSLPGSEIECRGTVEFRSPSFGEGTELVVSMSYSPPGGKPAAKALEMVGRGLQRELEEDLRGFKQVMEAGERPIAVPKEPVGKTPSQRQPSDVGQQRPVV